MNKINKNKRGAEWSVVSEAFSQIFIMIVSIFAFAFIVGGMTSGLTPLASADDYYPRGCCLKSLDGAICQNMNLLDAGACSTNLLSTSCDTVDNCARGCCYSASDGYCSFNSPKEQCQNNGGEWNSDPNCNIGQCLLGCCILGTEAAVTTTRQCTLLSNELNFEKNFQALDSDGTCSSLTGLTETGACLTPSGDYSGDNDCVFIDKGSCDGEFYSGFLCTANQLNSTCKPSKDTTCVEGKDQVYYLDSCGNLANIYDANKFNDQSYWEKEITPEESCGAEGKDCGNCDYLDGSRCYEYRQGQDAKPTYGDYICRDLNCDNGKKHGQSWCISDYDMSKSAVAPVGSRNFIGTCVEGEVSITPCADFNQEICVQKSGEAQCTVNDWRSCIAANEFNTTEEVERECDKYNQCVMFLDIPGNEKYEDLPGFKKDIPNELQGATPDAGKGANAVVVKCVPKYTPGMVFWASAQNGSAGASSYGGSLEETQAICAMGGFTCVSHAQKKPAATGEWKDKENWECNWNAYDHSQKVKAETIPLLMEALNERCRALGPCGAYVNIEGQVGDNAKYLWQNVIRSKIDKEGKQHNNLNASGYVPSESYISSLAGKAGLVKAGSLSSLSMALTLTLITGRATEPADSGVNVGAQAAGAVAGAQPDDLESTMPIVGSLGGLALWAAPSGAAAGTAAAAGTPLIGGTVTSGVLSVSTSGGTAVGGVTGSLAASVSQPLTITTVNGVTTLSGPAIEGGSLTASSITAQGPISGTGLTTPAAAGSAGGAGTGGAAGSGAGGGTLTSGTSLLGTGLTIVGATALAATAGYYVGQLIGKWGHMSPGQTSALSTALAVGFGGAALAYTGASAIATSGASATGAGLGTVALGTTTTAATGGAVGTGGAAITGPLMAAMTFFWVVLAAAVIAAVILALFTGEDNEYYTMTYTCGAWEPPRDGNCKLCNDDIRPCSEYRCKSLGLNCEYYNDLGEPGYCAAISDTWSAKITPWYEIITEGNSYTAVTDRSFSITGSSDNGKVAAWTPLEFGIITDKAAVCKIDNVHTEDYDSMSTTMYIDTSVTGCESGSCGAMGTHHRIALSSFIDANSSGTATLPLVTGEENNYYIRCKNFAGQVNEAEFAVKIIVDDSPDYTAPDITTLVPLSNSYLKQGTNSTPIMLYVNEPAECRYSQGGDSRFEEMPFNMSCMTGGSSAVLGRWPCYTTLYNLTAGTNYFYFECKDKPDLTVETALERRIINYNSEEYILNVCESGLEITSVFPQEAVVTGSSPIYFAIEAQTSGCINGGEATCYYNMGDGDIAFLNTGTTIHKQEFTSMPAGARNITIKCEDEAGNTANSSLFVNISLDNTAPIIQRAYVQNNMLLVRTNEDAVCKYSDNSTIECSYKFDDANIFPMDGEGIVHTTAYTINKEYYIRCRDRYNNTQSNCGIIVKAY